MEISGKKQIDIREDNKSAVIDLLLKSEMTVLEMSSALDLSHTAIAKVIKELVQKNVVQAADNPTPCFGRPPKVYRINRDCAIACAVTIGTNRIYAYYFDMRGFQINSIETENTFESADEMVAFIADKVQTLNIHPRLEEKILKYIYVGIPTEGVCNAPFASVKEKIDACFSERFQEVHTVVQCNANYQLLAELKYGALRNRKKNAILVDFNKTVNAAFLFDGSIYRGDNERQGRFLEEDLFADKALDENVEQGEAVDVQTEKKIKSAIKRLACFVKILDVHSVVFSGFVKEIDWFMPFVQKELGKETECVFSAMGKDVPAALSGAVWQSTYSTLMKVMLR